VVGGGGMERGRGGEQEGGGVEVEAGRAPLSRSGMCACAPGGPSRAPPRPAQASGPLLHTTQGYLAIRAGSPARVEWGVPTSGGGRRPPLNPPCPAVGTESERHRPPPCASGPLLRRPPHHTGPCPARQSPLPVKAPTWCVPPGAGRPGGGPGGRPQAPAGRGRSAGRGRHAPGEHGPGRWSPDRRPGRRGRGRPLIFMCVGVRVGGCSWRVSGSVLLHAIGGDARAMKDTP
jgi:hypothetical protein